jgi:SAM-dependent methyltransferase
MESIDCLFCSSSCAVPLFEQRDLNLNTSEKLFALVRCQQCGLIYQNPRPNETEIAGYYPDDYYPAGDTGTRRKVDRLFKRISNALKNAIMVEFYGYPPSTDTSSNYWKSWFRRVALLPEYWHLQLVGREILPYRGEGRILDVGCGPGKLLRVLRERGWDAYGVDFSAVAVAEARQQGLKVELGDLFRAQYENRFFDVVLFNHSLEHMFRPLEMLREAYRILKSDGELVIYIPNASSFEARLFGRWWVHWDLPRHLYHFGPDTLARLLRQAGFHKFQMKSNVGTSSFLGSIDYVLKHALNRTRRHGKLMKHFIAKPLCLVLGHCGLGAELQVRAHKALPP